VINGEPCYERHGYFEEPELRVSRAATRRAAWWSVLGGANAGVTYGASGVWHWFHPGERVYRDHLPMPRPWDEAMTFPGADDYARLKAVLAAFRFGSLRPRQEVLVDEPPTVRAAELPADDALLVYAPEGGRVTLAPDAVGSGPDLRWLDPATGREVAATFERGDDGVAVAGAPWGGDAVLLSL
jgi:hypothetical protein